MITASAMKSIETADFSQEYVCPSRSLLFLHLIWLFSLLDVTWHSRGSGQLSYDNTRGDDAEGTTKAYNCIVPWFLLTRIEYWFLSTQLGHHDLLVNSIELVRHKSNFDYFNIRYDVIWDSLNHLLINLLAAYFSAVTSPLLAHLYL